MLSELRKDIIPEEAVAPEGSPVNTELAAPGFESIFNQRMIDAFPRESTENARNCVCRCVVCHCVCFKCVGGN